MNAPDKPLDIAAIMAHMAHMGAGARRASAVMAKASAAQKNKALLHLAALLRRHTPDLQPVNALDIDRARAAGLSAQLVDRLKLDAQTLETCAQGCEQLAAMANACPHWCVRHGLRKSSQRHH